MTKTRLPRRPVSRRPRQPAAGARGHRWAFSLYVTDDTPRSRLALANLTALCEATVPGRSEIEIIDILQQAARGRADEILAIPTVIRTAPTPVRRVIGDLRNAAHARAGLQLTT